MSLWHCKNCTTAYSVGAEKCPHCESSEYQTVPVQRAYVCTGCETPYRIRLSSCPRCRGTKFKETSMAKITKAGGPSNADLDEQDVVEEPLPAKDEEPSPEEPAADEPEAEEQEDPDGTDESTKDEQPSEPDAEQVSDYNSLTVVELREKLDQRGLSTAGLKAELVERLAEADAAKE